MVYYLTLHSCAYIGIVGTPQTTRRSASASVQLHHPRGKRGSEHGRRWSCGVYNVWTTRSHRTPDTLQRPDGRRPLDVRRTLDQQQTKSTAPGQPSNTRRPTTSSHRTSDAYRKSGATCPEPKRRKSDALRTSGPPRATGRPTSLGRPAPTQAQPGQMPMYPLLTYPYET